MTPEQIKEHDDIQKKVESGNLGEDDFGRGGKKEGADDDEDNEEGDGERETVHSLPPPPSTKLTWDDYINARNGL